MVADDDRMRICPNCGKRFYAIHKKQLYCDKKCYADFYHKKQKLNYVPAKSEYKIQFRTCAFCGKQFLPNTFHQKYCNNQCCLNANGRVSGLGRYIIFERDNFKCIYCGRTSFEDGVKLHADHIVPKALGGQNVAGNLVTACTDCNLSKTDNAVRIAKRIKRVVAKRNELRGINSAQLIKFGNFGNQSETTDN